MSSHPLPWLLWVASAATLTMLGSNPLYTVLLLLVSRIVATAAGQKENRVSRPFWMLSATIIVVSGFYSALFVHIGQHILVHLPPWPLIGGPITLESVVSGAVNGLTLVTLLSIFLTLGDLVPSSQLVRLTPAALADAGLVLMIALNYFPQTKRHLEKVRDAQLIRGNRLKHIRDWRPLMVPLLIGGLERSMNLAEAMAARGIGSTTSINHSSTRRGLMTFSLGLTLSGGMMVPLQAWIGYLFVAAGLLLAGTLLWSTNKGTLRRTAFRPLPWSPVAVAMGATGCVVAIVVVLFSRLSGDDSLIYTAYPSLSWPRFDWWIGFLLCAMAAPVLIASPEKTDNKDTTSKTLMANH